MGIYCGHPTEWNNRSKAQEQLWNDARGRLLKPFQILTLLHSVSLMKQENGSGPWFCGNGTEVLAAI